MLISAGSLNKKITVYKRVVTTLKGKSSVSYTKYKGVNEKSDRSISFNLYS